MLSIMDLRITTDPVSPGVGWHGSFELSGRGRRSRQAFRMRTASNAAFLAIPIPTVPTGHPGGSCAIA